MPEIGIAGLVGDPRRRPAHLRAERLPEIGRSLGKGMREFKDSITGKDDDKPEITATSSADDKPSTS